MFHIGLTEWVLLAIIGLFLIGPEKLPKMTQVIGRFINELRSVIDSITTGDFTKRPTAPIQQISKTSTISIKPDTSKSSPSESSEIKSSTAGRSKNT